MNDNQSRKAAAMALLKANNINTAVAHYDGCGDSGYLDHIEVKAANDDQFKSLRSWPTGQSSTASLAINEQFEELAWDILMTFHEGFENNCGGFGKMYFDVAAATLTIKHSERYEEVNTSEHEV